MIYELGMAVFGAMLYAVFFASMTERIQKHKERLVRKYFRNLYINLFVKALQGRHKFIVANASLSLYILYILLIVFFVTYLKIQVVAAGEEIKRIDKKFQESDKPMDVTKEKEDVAKSIAAVKLQAAELLLQIQIAYCIVVGLGLLYAIFIHPKSMMVVHFGIIIDDFKQQLYNIATKNESCEIYTLISNVKDEKSAQLCMRKIKEIGKKYNFSDAIERVSPWENLEDAAQNSTSPSAPRTTPLLRDSDDEP